MGKFIDIDKAVVYYESGKTIKQIADAMGVSVGKVYYVLRDCGCEFRSAGTRKGYHINRKAPYKKRGPMSEEQKKLLSEVKRCHYNGLNGYGHTKRHNGGYVLVYVPDHPAAHSDGYAMFHTVLMERSIGRYLKKDEVVHHVNHKRDDNRLENLMLMNQHDHYEMHLKERHGKVE